MGSTLEHGIYLPSEGEKNCYQGLASNWNKVDGALGDVAELRQLIESKFTKEIVTELPTEDINPYCIYMILKTDPETDNIYDEWVYINNAWEYLGNTKVDMTQYYTKQEVNQLPAVASGVTATKVGNYDAHIANGDIHVTASDKTKWNTVALIKQLRLVNTQVGSATTIAFANIDDTNGIKVGDKCMDLDAKMFEITAVDTANQTVTVGSALIDLALDSDVVHKSGNESISGNKTFSATLYIYNSDNTGNTPNLLFKSSKAIKGDTSGSNSGSSKILHVDKNDKWLGYIQFRKVANGASDITLYCSTQDANNQDISSSITLFKAVNGQGAFRPDADNDVNLGTSTYKWKDVNTYHVNNLEPSSLSLPSGDASNFIDISSYFANTGSGDTNSYTASANGWIYLRLGDISSCQATVYDSNNNRMWGQSSTGSVEQMTIPILKGQTLTTQWNTSSTVNVANARFIPCQGNV